MKTVIKFWLKYDRTTKKITASSIPSLVGTPAKEAINSPEVAKIFDDAVGSSHKKVLMFFDITKSTKCTFRSATGKGVYTFSTSANGDDCYFEIRLESEGDIKYRTPSLIVAIAAFVMIVVAGLSTIVALRASMLTRKREEAATTVKMVSEQIDTSLSDDFESWRSELRLIGSMFDGYETVDGNETTVDSILDDTRGTLPFSDIALLLKSGELYFSQSRKFNIIQEKIAQQLIVDQLPSQIDTIKINGEEKIIIAVQKAKKTRNTEQRSVTAVCAIIDPPLMRKLLSVDIFDGKSVQTIIQQEGYKVAASDNTDPANRYNFFDILRASASEEKFNKVETDFANGNSDMISLTYKGDSHFIYYSALHAGNQENPHANTWHLVIYVPENAVFKTVNEVFNEILTVMLVYFVLIVVSTGAVASLILHQQGENARLQNQALINAMLEESVDKALEVSDAKTKFFANMSHDIRTPINGIIGMTAIAMQNTENAAVVTDCLKKIDGTSAHLLNLINDVLDMTRIESKKITIVNEPINIRQLADKCYSIVSGQLVGRDIDFRLEENDIVNADVLGDGLHIRQVLINILGNAIKFTPDGGKVLFQVKETSSDKPDISNYVFTVSDTGCGIKEELLNKIFDPFVQEHNNSRSNYNGTGLGLAIAKQLANLMGGDIEVQSQQNKGSVFTVTIPMTVDKDFVSTDEDCLQYNEVSPVGKRVLLVEDNQLNCEIADALLKQNGMLVETASNGQEAVEMFQAHKEHYYDLILMDVMMPVMDGITATKIIRASDNPFATTIPIVAITANAFEEDIRLTREAGMNAHLSKPIRIDDVLRVIGRILYEAEHGQLSGGGVVANTDDDQTTSSATATETCQH